MEKWQEEGYVETENGLLEKVVVKKIVHNDTCCLVFTLYHVGNKADYREWPDGSWYELEISNFAKTSVAITNRMKFYTKEEDLDQMLEFIMEAKPILKKYGEDLKNL
jgi:hypothetical protein